MENNFLRVWCAAPAHPQQGSTENQVESQIQAFYEMWNGRLFSSFIWHLFTASKNDTAWAGEKKANKKEDHDKR